MHTRYNKGNKNNNHGIVPTPSSLSLTTPLIPKSVSTCTILHSNVSNKKHPSSPSIYKNLLSYKLHLAHHKINQHCLEFPYLCNDGAPSKEGAQGKGKA